MVIFVRVFLCFWTYLYFSGYLSRIISTNSNGYLWNQKWCELHNTRQFAGLYLKVMFPRVTMWAFWSVVLHFKWSPWAWQYGMVFLIHRLNFKSAFLFNDDFVGFFIPSQSEKRLKISYLSPVGRVWPLLPNSSGSLYFYLIRIYVFLFWIRVFSFIQCL